jgi:IS4 transposase
MLPEVFTPFLQASPLSVIARATLQHAFSAQTLDALFEAHAERQYTHELLFSTLVALGYDVVFRTQRSVHDAYQARRHEIAVSAKAVYDKLNRLELGVSEALVCQTADRLRAVVTALKGTTAPLLAGYRVKVLDGNHLAGTEHRPRPLRSTRAAPLPGVTLVVREAATGLVTAVVCCEDAYTQERALVERVLPRVAARDVWIADRNFCTGNFLWAVVARKAFFLVRQHRSTLTVIAQRARRRSGRTATGVVYQQRVQVRDGQGRQRWLRRVILVLDRPTRGGDTELHLLTNLPVRVGAVPVAELYRQRWTIENAFGELTTMLRCEIDTLAYPKAALFCFCLALLAYNVIAVVRAALRAAHGVAAAEQVATYYLAGEIGRVYAGMMIALPPAVWEVFAGQTAPRLAATLKQLAATADLQRYARHPRGPQKPPPRRTSGAIQHHVSTYRVLRANK